MTDRDELNNKMADIGSRYIKRTLGEVVSLRSQLVLARAGDTQALKEVERASHKIYGSGAMFGFDAVSECAHQIELLTEGSVVSDDVLQQLEKLLDALDLAVHEAAHSRGIE